MVVRSWGFALPILAALLDPGTNSAAVVSFEGSVRFGPSHVLAIELGAPTLGSYDRLEIQGSLEAAGTLAVTLLPGFTASVGDSYEIVTAGAITGAFAYGTPDVGAGLTLALEQTATSIRLTVAADCNGNGLADPQEIDDAPALDCDGNLTLDECDIASAGGDSNANGVLDSCEVLRLDVAAEELSWEPLIVASVYDVVAGDLTLLRASSGDFTAATEICLADDEPATTLAHAADPDPGQGTWFLVRAVAGAVPLSFDTFTPSQAGSRDAEIAASPAACP